MNFSGHNNFGGVACALRPQAPGSSVKWWGLGDARALELCRISPVLCVFVENNDPDTLSICTQATILGDWERANKDGYKLDERRRYCFGVGVRGPLAVHSGITMMTLFFDFCPRLPGIVLVARRRNAT